MTNGMPEHKIYQIRIAEDLEGKEVAVVASTGDRVLILCKDGGVLKLGIGDTEYENSCIEVCNGLIADEDLVSLNVISMKECIKRQRAATAERIAADKVAAKKHKEATAAAELKLYKELKKKYGNK